MRSVLEDPKEKDKEWKLRRERPCWRSSGASNLQQVCCVGAALPGVSLGRCWEPERGHFRCSLGWGIFYTVLHPKDAAICMLTGKPQRHIRDRSELVKKEMRFGRGLGRDCCLGQTISDLILTVTS